MEFEQLQPPPKLYSARISIPDSIPCDECDDLRGEVIDGTCVITPS